MTSRLTLVLAIFSLLLVSYISPSSSADSADLDEFLTFLESDESDRNDAASNPTPLSDPHFSDDDVSDDDFENYDDFEVPSGLDRDDENLWPAIDDKDVVVLGDRNFSGFVESNRYVMVEFYAPWCGHCQSLAPEYAAAATELKGEAVALAKVDATEERELAEEYEVQGFPTVYFFVDGEHKPYTGQRTKEAIVTWIKKKIGPGVYNISTIEDAERVLTSENKVVLGFLESLVGPESEELSAASKLEDNVNFYQTVNPDVAKLFHMDPDSKRPALVMLKREVEKLSHFGGQFKKSVIAEFVSANKLPLVTIFTRESGTAIFESPIKKQILLFATSNDSEKVIPTFQEAAKAFKGKLIFVYVEMDNEEVGRPVADYFGITGNSPKVIGYSGNNDGNKYVLNGEPTLDKIKAFGEDFVQDKLKPFYKSDPIPEPNDEDVKIVVGDNFDDIVLDESKDVLLEIYAPWCGHCQALEPTYKKLAKHLRAIESLVIAKMDGSTNEHPKAKAEGFPTLLFFPAGNKSVDPITVDSDRTVVSFYKFIKKHASIPFKLKKPVFTAKPESSDAKESSESSTNDVKDEL
ncbi:LOW QUALITY PROTEIN: protein disulfide isomerase-like 1-4 [Actinidia eriantha]|uniref:LOW QUALITY PROTEIN: protein disulfide isomerase-like 1-4 n=1 Tax=Actinidia eriantha TaxID=165200 RepID=UPI0025876FB2|nr:LOW QUALITY PROTEIN: protein disulfide isomerase-like 1-4 [Actinidia eriantha]